MQALAWPVALLAGWLQAASLAWPLPGSGYGQPLWWLQMASLVLLARLVRSSASVGRAAAYGGVFATAWLVGTFWWLFISMHTYGGLAAPLAVLAVLGLAGFLASYYAGACALVRAAWPQQRWRAALLFGAAWTLAELARGTWWTGFPWGAAGYAHVDGPLQVLARSVGVYGIGAVAASAAMGLAQVRRSDLRRASTGMVLVTLAVLLTALGWQRHCAINDGCAAAPTLAASRPALTLALLQGNIPQDEKFEPGTGVPLALQWYGQALHEANAQLVVAPETAIPLLPRQLPHAYWQRLQERYTRGNQAALIGIPLGNKQAGYTNSVLGLQPGGLAHYRYDKHHLVPFGEFIPPLFTWFTQMMNIPLGDFLRGSLAQAPLHWQGERIAPHICYEDLFGEELGARFALDPQAPTIFVNLSNIGWFGNGIAIEQHLQISRMRALEFERPMVRATNTGATAIIDHRGTVTHQLAANTRGVLLGAVQGRDSPATPYAQWVAHWGLWPLWIFAIVVILGLAKGFSGLIMRGYRCPCRLRAMKH